MNRVTFDRKQMNGVPCAALVSWGVALVEYLLQVPVKQIGHTTINSDGSRSCKGRSPTSNQATA